MEDDNERLEAEVVLGLGEIEAEPLAEEVDPVADAPEEANVVEADPEKGGALETTLGEELVELEVEVVPKEEEEMAEEMVEEVVGEVVDEVVIVEVVGEALNEVVDEVVVVGMVTDEVVVVEVVGAVVKAMVDDVVNEVVNKVFNEVVIIEVVGVVVGKVADEVVEETETEPLAGVVPIADAPDTADMFEVGASKNEPLELAADELGRGEPEVVPEPAEEVVKTDTDAEADVPLVNPSDVMDALEVGADEAEPLELVPEELEIGKPEFVPEVPEEVGEREPLALEPNKLGRGEEEAILEVSDEVDKVEVLAEDAVPVADALAGEAPCVLDGMDEAGTDEVADPEEADPLGPTLARFEEPDAAVEIVPDEILVELEASAVVAEIDPDGGGLRMLDPEEVETS